MWFSLSATTEQADQLATVKDKGEAVILSSIPYARKISRNSKRKSRLQIRMIGMRKTAFMFSAIFSRP